LKRWRGITVFLLAFSGLYLYGFPSPTTPYFVIVIFHGAAGALLTALLLLPLLRLFHSEKLLARVGWIFVSMGAAIGVVLLWLGTAHRYDLWLYAHIGLCALGTLALLMVWLGSQGWTGSVLLRGAGVMVALVAVSAGAWWMRTAYWNRSYRIENPPMPPATMDGEGDGPEGRFFPSSAQTLGDVRIPAKYFMQSNACERCHHDIYEQWYSSMHHFSSFNNQWYRKSIEYMQDTIGVKPSRWCAGCHDPALLFSGMFDTPIKEIVQRPEAQAGLACMMCHSMTHVKSTMGQGDYVLEYPKLHELAASENPVERGLHDFLVRLNPEPHRRTFLKPLMRKQTAEFCSTCHKVHLDVPVNHYRWIRGFNEYDNWQASGISGLGARSFYYPPAPMACQDCHMPLVPSHDEGNINGLVHSHRFPGANTAVPFANGDQTQLEVSQKFLGDNSLSVDVFAVAPAGATVAGRAMPGAQLATTFAVGEEGENTVPTGAVGELRPITAPLGRVDAAVRRGDDLGVDVVVRTKKVGHFFPAGTVDAFDVWLELKATDEKGQTLFWSGRVEDGGKGPVEKHAHFYRSLQLDAHGNPINKRNAWSTRSVVYVRLIPPGAADTVHYRMHVPDRAGERITLHAKLNYRKFSWWNTHFAYAGMRAANQSKPDVTPDYDDSTWEFKAETSSVSGALKRIPDLPIISVAEDLKFLRVLPRKAPAPNPQLQLAQEDFVRWQDYGIGLFLQGDLKGAQAAFEKTTEIDPQNVDGWVNIGRVRVQEGNMQEARRVLQRALTLKPDLARANYFYARVLKTEGHYDEAIARLRLVLAQYPKDRVVRNELGRELFLEKRYAEAVAEFQQVLRVDPEDLQAHYNLMLCYGGLGDQLRANEHKQRYLRFKADEASQAITGPYRQAHPEDNNERQAIHEHVSVPLDTPEFKPGRPVVVAAHATASRTREYK